MLTVFSADTLKFLQQWINAPLVVGAVAPSGPALAELITSRIDSYSAPVLELGPGTGVFSRALIARGLRERDLTLVESGAEFASMLKMRFPEARVLRMDAAVIGGTPELLPASFGAAVSGLPLLSMRARKVTDIVTGAFKLMRPGSALFQFTYGPSCPVPRAVMDQLGLQARKIGGALLNIPPASVYEITAKAVLR
jgi:phospholipid N-methyltransferase